MRLPLAVLALTVSLAACAARSARPTGNTVQVTIQVSCDDHSVTFSVTPWAAHLHQGDDISWTLAPGSNTQDVTLNQVHGKWPFNDSPPVDAKPNNPAHVGHMKPNLPAGDTYHYTIEADCQASAGPKIHGKIDPDMIID